MPNNKGRLSVTKETESGRNTGFRDNRTGEKMNRSELVSAIKAGEYPDYHVRNVNGLPTPVSNPDRKKDNNLG